MPDPDDRLATAPSLSLPIAGDAAPPRENGELVFDEPWQARLFGVTLDLVESGALSWSEFQQELIVAIRDRDEQAVTEPSTERGSPVRTPTGGTTTEEGSEQAAGDAISLDAPADRQQQHYYLGWLSALEHLLGRGLLDPHVLADLRRELAARPHGHDH